MSYICDNGLVKQVVNMNISLDVAFMFSCCDCTYNTSQLTQDVHGRKSMSERQHMLVKVR